MTTTPAGSQPPTSPVLGAWQPLPNAGATDPQPGGPETAPKPLQPLTKTQKILTGVVVGGVLVIATLGFIGSYDAVTKLATAKGFGDFADAFPIAVDAGIIAFLALDLLLTWRRIPFALLRYTAWILTAATIAFNGVVSWPDPVGTSMHGVIPILFVIAVEAARHAVGRIADITADKHIEGPPAARWLLNPGSTFVLFRRQRLWGIRTWNQMLALEQERRIYIGKLRKQHGRGWRRAATADQLLVLRLAKTGMGITDALELPAKEEEKQRAKKARIEQEQREAANQRRREEDDYNRGQQRLEDERLQKLEDERLEREEKALQLARQRKEEERQQAIADAEAEARLAEIERKKQEADAEAQRRQEQAQLELARQIADERTRAAAAEKEARLEADRKLESTKLAADLMSRVSTASPSASASHHRANANATAASKTANPVGFAANANAPTAANDTSGTASQAASSASASGASRTPASVGTANASANRAGATTGTGTANGSGSVDIKQVVAVFDLLLQQDGAAPSDAKLGDALGVSRSRAQQLRTAAIEAGHTHLAKPLRIAS